MLMSSIVEQIPGCLVVQVFLDGAIIPGWEGKIVAWLEEDYGEER